jgi:hypothetical protein
MKARWHPCATREKKKSHPLVFCCTHKQEKVIASFTKKEKNKKENTTYIFVNLKKKSKEKANHAPLHPNSNLARTDNKHKNDMETAFFSTVCFMARTHELT